MSELLPFLKCFNPLWLRGDGVERVQVPCGSCIACQNQKRQALSLKLHLEELNSAFTYLITLTYDNEHLPLYRLIEHDSLKGVLMPCPISDRIVLDPGDYEDSKDTPFIKQTSILYDSIRRYNAQVRMHQFNRRVCVPYGNGTFALLYYRDAQLFIKRLRKYIDKYFMKRYVTTLSENMVHHHCVRIGICYCSSTRLHLPENLRLSTKLALLADLPSAPIFFVHSGNMVLLTLNGQTNKHITTFLRMLTSLLLFLPFLTCYLNKRVITPIGLVRFYRKKHLSILSENVTLTDLEIISLPILMALRALLPCGGRITMSSFPDLVGSVFALMRKHSQYCQALKD